MSVYVHVTVSTFNNKKAMLSQGKLHDATSVLGLKFADIIHYGANVTLKI